MEYRIIIMKFVIMQEKGKKLLKKQIALKLYQVRNALDIKQKDLEEEGIISQSQLSKIENGELNISAVILYLLARRYNKSIDYFFDNN